MCIYSLHIYSSVLFLPFSHPLCILFLLWCLPCQLADCTRFWGRRSLLAPLFLLRERPARLPGEGAGRLQTKPKPHTTGMVMFVLIQSGTCQQGAPASPCPGEGLGDRTAASGQGVLSPGFLDSGAGIAIQSPVLP